ncbi:MAG: hypothetical protein LC130_16260 [Bryobacterales bacterium]|jgi:hypothetical protein|nr:hypothetical protein [Bryobacterales bacterium]
MFQTVEPQQIFDSRYWQVSDTHPAYWLAQLRKPDWQELLRFLEIKVKSSARKPALASATLERLTFAVCDTRADAWHAWSFILAEQARGLVIQFRHSETDWTRGIPEFVRLDRCEPLGYVNIAARMVCKVR